jgi:hypothetical protein
MKLIHTLGVVALLILVSCDTTSQPPPVDYGPPIPGQPPAALEQGLPPLAQLSSHTVSYIEPVTKPGIDVVHEYGNVSYGASTAALEPPANDLAFVVYALPVNGFSYDEVSFDVTFDDPAKCWFGIGDYQRDSWALTPASPGITSVAPPYSTAHAPDGNAYFAVIAYNGTTVTVNEVSLSPNFPSWQHHVIDDDGTDLGLRGDMVLIDGFLYVAHVPWDIDEIRLARATVPIPNSPGDWEHTLIGDSDDTDRIILRQVNGLPAAAYADG